MVSPAFTQPTRRRALRERRHFNEDESESPSSDQDEPDRSGSLYPDLSDIDSPKKLHKLKRRSSSSSRSHETEKNFSHSESFDSPQSAKKKRGTDVKPSYPKLEKLANEPEASNTPYIYPALILCIVVTIIYAAVVHNSRYSRKLLDPSEVRERIYSNIKGFMKDFDQTEEFLKHLHAQVTDMVEERPIQPSILFVVVPPKSQETANCLVRKITEAVRTAFEDAEVPVFNVEEYVNDDVDELKHHLEDTLSKLSYCRTIIIDHLELLNPQASNILHAFCDNENAHHKQALIMFMLSVTDSFSVCESLGVESYVQTKLYDLWSEIKQERVAAMHTRIANAPVLVKPASADALAKHCS